MIKTKAIDHVVLWVRSLAEAREYYERVFGFNCTPRPGDDNTLVVESEAVHFFISQSEGMDAFIAKQHISFEVDTLEMVITSLKELGVTDFEVGRVNLFKHKNYKWCEWRDPNGIRLECVEVL